MSCHKTQLQLIK